MSSDSIPMQVLIPFYYKIQFSFPEAETQHFERFVIEDSSRIQSANLMESLLRAAKAEDETSEMSLNFVIHKAMMILYSMFDTENYEIIELRADHIDNEEVVNSILRFWNLLGIFWKKMPEVYDKLCVDMQTLITDMLQKLNLNFSTRCRNVAFSKTVESVVKHLIEELDEIAMYNEYLMVRSNPALWNFFQSADSCKALIAEAGPTKCPVCRDLDLRKEENIAIISSCRDIVCRFCLFKIKDQSFFQKPRCPLCYRPMDGPIISGALFKRIKFMMKLHEQQLNRRFFQGLAKRMLAEIRDNCKFCYLYMVVLMIFSSIVVVIFVNGSSMIFL